jgi:murein DD-endopeptidase MepM/ murein hydrolase activator NlpD
MEDIIGNLGGSIKSSGIASPFPYLENLRPIISSGYESIDSAHATEHGGTDLAVGQGTSVYSASSGKVIASYNNCGYGSLGSKCGPTGYGGYGNIVVVESYDDNGKPYYVYYAHMEAGSVGVNVGDTIETGTYLGGVGSSGSSTGYHLHFEVRQGANDKNYQVNPLAFFGLN